MQQAQTSGPSPVRTASSSRRISTVTRGLLALLFAASNHDLVNKWFQEPELARQLSLGVIQKTTAFDPQWGAKSITDIRVSFSDSELGRYVGLGTTAHALKIYSAQPPIQQKLDLAAAQKVDAAGWAFDPASVKIKP